jgi:hypothetical protein
MRNIFSFVIAVALLTPLSASALSVSTVPQGGTGSSTLTGILKGNSTSAVRTAVAGSDYQAPISLTTTGTSGQATFIANTLNIPQYSGGGTGAPFPFTSNANFNSTSTVLGFLNGLFSTASSTFNSAVRFPALSDGALAVNNGLLYGNGACREWHQLFGGKRPIRRRRLGKL